MPYIPCVIPTPALSTTSASDVITCPLVKSTDAAWIEPLVSRPDWRINAGSPVQATTPDACARAVDPSGPIGPVDPVVPLSPLGPCAPAAPCTPVAPCGPVAPAGPAGPLAPASPLGPWAPGAPRAP